MTCEIGKDSKLWKKDVFKKGINNPRFALTLFENFFKDLPRVKFYITLGVIFVRIFKLIAHLATLRFGLKMSH